MKFVFSFKGSPPGIEGSRCRPEVVAIMGQALTNPFLAADAFIDADHPELVAFAHRHGGGLPRKEAVVALFHAIRDGWVYNPWQVGFRPEDFKASVLLGRSRERGGHCIDKASLLVGCARALGVPARLHFADVRNHIGTARLEKLLGTDRLVFHGWAELWLDGRWIGATPAFNRELCEKLGVAPLDFDGERDAVFQEYDRRAGRFMEYLEDHGSHATIPFEAMLAAWKRHYPSVREGRWPRPPSRAP